MKIIPILLFILVLIVGALALGAQFSLSARPDPSQIEARLALKVRHWIISWEVRKHTAKELPAGPDTIGSGGMTFNGDCAFCHGQDGRTPSDVGQGMYPRVPSLASPEVQQWSDAELFWIIRNGNRYTGMGGFGKSLSDEQIWDLVHYVRSLGSASPSGTQPNEKSQNSHH
jgi:mono/diheme cytochrome c family protein